MNGLDFTGDYKTTLSELIDGIEKQVNETSREERMTLVESVTDDYIEQTGEKPNGQALHRLADFILHEELSDMHADKMTREEAPIMSEHQEGRRKEGKQRFRNKTGTVTKEVPLDHAGNVATDGRNYTLPARSFVNPW